jgi:hypothetical protein
VVENRGEDATPAFTELLVSLDEDGMGSGFSCAGAGYLVGVEADGGVYWAISNSEPTPEVVEILTQDGISYARVTPGSEPAPVNRSRVIERVGTSWGSWGEPDSILLEMTPAAPSACLGWEGVVEDTAAASVARTNGVAEFTFDVALEDEMRTLQKLTGVYTPGGGDGQGSFVLSHLGRVLLTVTTGYTTISDPLLELSRVVELSRD